MRAEIEYQRGRQDVYKYLTKQKEVNIIGEEDYNVITIEVSDYESLRLILFDLNSLIPLGVSLKKTYTPLLERILRTKKGKI